MSEEKELTPAEQMQEKIVISSRENILPFFKEKNLTVEETKHLCESLAIVINQGSYDLMAKNTVAALELDTKINKEYPGYENFSAMIERVKDLPMMEAINALQWFAEKVKKTVDDENKDRSFSDLGIDF